MLRKSVKRLCQDVAVIPEKKRNSSNFVVGDGHSPSVSSVERARGLEDQVFSGCDLEDGDRSVTLTENVVDSRAEIRIAWDDEYELTDVSTKESQPPAWAQISNNSSTNGNLEAILNKAGDVLERAIHLPKGNLQFKSLVDANIEDDTEGRMTNVEFHPSEKVMLTAAGGAHRLSLFQVDGQNNSRIQTIYFEDYPIQTAHFSTDGNEIVVGSQHKNLYCYDMIAGRVINVPKINSLGGSNMAKFEVSPDGRILAFLGKYGNIHLISAKSKEWITTMNMNGNVSSIAFKKDGTKMYSFGTGGTVFIWDINTRDCVHTFQDDGCLNGTTISSSPNDQYIACGSQSGIVNIYSPDSCHESISKPKPVKSLKSLTTVCSKTKFNFSSEILAVASNETKKAIRLIHFPSMHAFSNFPASTDNRIRIPQSFDFSPNGGYMAIGTTKGRALLYRLGHYDSY